MSAYTDALTAFETNKSYKRENSLSMAQLFVEACMTLLVTPSTVRRDGQGETRVSTSDIRQMMETAERWVSSNSTDDAPNTGAVQFADLSER